MTSDKRQPKNPYVGSLPGIVKGGAVSLRLSASSHRDARLALLIADCWKLTAPDWRCPDWQSRYNRYFGLYPSTSHTTPLNAVSSPAADRKDFRWPTGNRLTLFPSETERRPSKTRKSRMCH